MGITKIFYLPSLTGLGRPFWCFVSVSHAWNISITNYTSYYPGVVFIVFTRLIFRWEGEGQEEVGKDDSTGKVLVTVDPRFYRPTEVVSKVIWWLSLTPYDQWSFPWLLPCVSKFQLFSWRCCVRFAIVVKPLVSLHCHYIPCSLSPRQGGRFSKVL